MKKAKNILLIILITATMIMATLTGCKPAAKKPTPARYTPSPTRTVPTPTRPAPGYTTPVPRTPVTPTPVPVRRPTTESARAAKIASNVAKIPEVNKATVVISGNTALVGIDMKSRVQGAHETNVKKKVEKTVRDTDKAIKNVSVTSDPDLYTRINNIAKGIAAGRPLSEFTKQISEILKRITPSA